MLKNRTNLLATVCFALFLMVPQAAQADSVQDKIKVLLVQIQELQMILTQREEYVASGPTEEGRADYFYYETSEGSEINLFGSQSQAVEFTVDADVQQLLLVTDCAEVDVRLFDWNSCESMTWVTGYDSAEWTRTFTVPVMVESETATVAEVDVFACRYNGCMLEDTITITQKPSRTFADDVVISDRYEWEYESGGNMIHEQEVLVSFPADDIRKVLLSVTCDDSGLFERTYSDTRVSCSSDHSYSRSDFLNVKTDELGNDYNLLLYTVTENIEVDQSGELHMEFKFYGMNNSVLATVLHTPIQKEKEINS